MNDVINNASNEDIFAALVTILDMMLMEKEKRENKILSTEIKKIYFKCARCNHVV